MAERFFKPTEIEPLHTPKKYLGVFILPKPQNEHKRLPEAIAHHSGNDFKLAFRQSMRDGSAVVGYLFTSATRPYDMGFGQVLLNGDQHLIVELGDMYSEEGLNVAGAWLRSRQPARK